jgi:hypothetical protein
VVVFAGGIRAGMAMHNVDRLERPTEGMRRVVAPENRAGGPRVSEGHPDPTAMPASTSSALAGRRRYFQAHLVALLEARTHGPAAGAGPLAMGRG